MTRVLLETHTYLCSVDYIVLASGIHITILKELFTVAHSDQDVTRTLNRLMTKYHEINFELSFSKLICSSLFVFQHSSNQFYAWYQSADQQMVEVNFETLLVFDLFTVLMQ